MKPMYKRIQVGCSKKKKIEEEKGKIKKELNSLENEMV